MSDFLLNLARRSAGLAPTMQSRLLPPSEAVTLPGVDVVDLAAASPMPPSARSSEPAASLMSPAAPWSISAPIVHRPIAATSAPVVQREALAPVMSPTPLPSAAALPAASPTAVPGTHARAADAPRPVREPVASIDPPRAPRPPGALSTPPEGVERCFEPGIGQDITRVVELVPASVGLAPRLDADGNRSVAPPQEAPRSAEAVAAKDRTVHVRIGTIEIHEKDAPAVAPPAPAAPVLPSVQGFDDFARLRSYAPWAW